MQSLTEPDIAITDFYPTEAQKIPHKPTPTPKQISVAERRETVIGLLLQGRNVSAIAKQLGVDRSTIYEDFEAWTKTEQAKYLQIEWLQQYEAMKLEDPQTAFDALTKLMMKLLEKQAKLEVNLTQNNETTVNINVKSMLAEYDHLFTQTDTEAGTIPADGALEQVCSPQTHGETSRIPVT